MTKPRNVKGQPKPPGSGRRPVSAETRARAVELGRRFMAGEREWTRNAIARELGVSPSSVSTWCHAAEPPVTFDRSASAVAVEARSADAKVARAELAASVLSEARRLVGLMSAPATVHTFDRDGVLRTGTLDAPPAGDVRNYAVAAGVLVDKHLALVRQDSDDRDLPAVEAWLRAMMGAVPTTVSA